ncbi:hypothetical protein Ancab_007417 [Ancistrocladus abbreviatus]
MSNPASYPPLFRTITSNPTHIPDPEHGTQVEQFQEQDPDPLPVIDVECLEVEKLEEACRECGMFRMVNHGIPAKLLEEIEDHAKRVFEMRFESKQNLFSGSPVSYFWGTPALTPSGVALSRGPQNIDWVEGLNFPLAQLPSLHSQLPLINAFRELLEEYGRHMNSLAKTLFEAIAKNLGLDSQVNHYTSSNGDCLLDESSGMVRVYRYPRCRIMAESGQVQGMDVHTDSSLLSILIQNEAGGLQFLKDDKWLQVKPISNTLVVNLGDMMQAVSNDEYKSVRHRVKLNTRKERMSICYFVFPEENSLIQSSNYRPFTYKDFRAQVQQDVSTVGSKVGLQRFKLAQLV